MLHKYLTSPVFLNSNIYIFNTLGKQLVFGQKKHLTDYKIENQSNLFVVLRLNGGTDVNFKELDEDVELSEAPDMISWEDDPSTPRAKMPCGHAIGKF